MILPLFFSRCDYKGGYWGRGQRKWSRGQGAESREQRVKSRGQGAEGREQRAGSRGQGTEGRG